MPRYKMRRFRTTIIPTLLALALAAGWAIRERARMFDRLRDSI